MNSAPSPFLSHQPRSLPGGAGGRLAISRILQGADANSFFRYLHAKRKRDGRKLHKQIFVQSFVLAWRHWGEDQSGLSPLTRARAHSHTPTLNTFANLLQSYFVIVYLHCPPAQTINIHLPGDRLINVIMIFLKVLSGVEGMCGSVWGKTTNYIHAHQVSEHELGTFVKFIYTPSIVIPSGSMFVTIAAHNRPLSGKWTQSEVWMQPSLKSRVKR